MNQAHVPMPDIYGYIRERVNMNNGELTLEFDERICTSELSFG